MHFAVEEKALQADTLCHAGRSLAWLGVTQHYLSERHVVLLMYQGSVTGIPAPTPNDRLDWRAKSICVFSDTRSSPSGLAEKTCNIKPHLARIVEFRLFYHIPQSPLDLAKAGTYDRIQPWKMLARSRRLPWCNFTRTKVYRCSITYAYAQNLLQVEQVRPWEGRHPCVWRMGEREREPEDGHAVTENAHATNVSCSCSCSCSCIYRAENAAKEQDQSIALLLSGIPMWQPFKLHHCADDCHSVECHGNKDV
ncbi:uncharacterized protein RAG0_01543 [Rhynchosporium agropyri]|uniref:Uncharacterized protein n=1 Tax=Rhynchosporium agropyri TaxID=914238 RepID=A0A1E1JX64_9HELO|nr:uncharacterized protein RAG0_01543 [Rhynchosporium agropyri]